MARAERAGVPPPDNPYKGPIAFEEKDAGFFFGRDTEAQALTALCISERLVLFCAQSGAGKTSLIKARLIPELREQQFHVLPPVRVSGKLPPRTTPHNVYAYCALKALSPVRRPEDTLDGFLRASRDGDTRPRVLILDQFEEILSSHPQHWAQREEFFLQLRRALGNDPTLSILLVMREDRIAGLERYLPLVTGHLRARFRMERLRRDEAVDAIREPARLAGRPFDAGVAEQLAEDLCQMRIAEQEETITGEFVEPVHLQVVCLKLWEKLRDRPPGNITFPDLDQSGKVDEALESFYKDAVEEAAHKTGVSERRIRVWCGTTLITPSHIRGQVSREPAQSGGLPNEAVDKLVDAHLIRPEEARGGTWYELAHDLFIEPILRSNEAWLRSQETPLAADARAWREADRNPSFLYRGRRLAEARALESADPDAVGDPEREFLARSREEEAVLFHRRFALLVLALLVVGAAAGVAFWQSWIAARESRLSASRELALAAIGKSESDPELGLVLALESLNKAPTPEAEVALHETLNASVVRKTGSVSFEAASTFAFSADGTRVAAAGDDGRVGVWDTASRRPLFVLRGDAAGRGPAALSKAVTSLAFDATGRLLAAGDAQGHIVIRDAVAGKVIRDWHVGAQVNGLTFAPGGSRLAVASDSPTASVWEVGAEARPLLLRRGHGSTVWDVAFSPDGRRLATVGDDGRIFLWDSRSGKRLRELPSQLEPVTGVAFSPDGTKLATAGQDRTARLWDLGTGETKSFVGHTDWIWDVAFSRDGRYLATGSSDGTAKIWEIRSGDPIDTLVPGSGQVVSVAFGTRPGELATASRPLPEELGGTGVATLWKVILDGDVRTLVSDATAFYSVEFSPDGQRIATADRIAKGNRKGRVTIWSPEGRLLSRISSAGGPVLDVAFAPHTNAWLATAHSDGEIQLWDVSSKIAARRATFRGPRAAANAVAFSPDQNRLAAAWQDGSVRILDLALRPVLALPAGHAEVFDTAFSPDSESLATADADGTVGVWDLTSGHLLLNLRHSLSVRHLAFHPTGKLLATAGVDGSVDLWNLVSGRLVDTLRGHTSQVNGVAFNPEGTRLATCSADSTVKFWDTVLGRELFALRGHRKAVYALAFSPDGKLLATAGADGTLRLEPLTIEDISKRARQRAQVRELSPRERRIYLHE